MGEIAVIVIPAVLRKLPFNTVFSVMIVVWFPRQPMGVTNAVVVTPHVTCTDKYVVPSEALSQLLTGASTTLTIRRNR